jgi:hypothetical protein
MLWRRHTRCTTKHIEILIKHIFTISNLRDYVWLWWCFMADILEYTFFDRQLNLGAVFSVFTSKHSSNRVHLVTCIFSIQVFCVVMLSGRVIDSRCFEGCTFLQISEINDTCTHVTTLTYKVQRVFDVALTPWPIWPYRWRQYVHSKLEIQASLLCKSQIFHQHHVCRITFE